MFESIDPIEASRRVAGGALLVDVREADEFAQARAPGAVPLPLSEFVARREELPLEREVVLVCAAGVRSAQAAAYAARFGHRVTNLEGGLAAWHAAGLPVEFTEVEK